MRVIWNYHVRSDTHTRSSLTNSLIVHRSNDFSYVFFGFISYERTRLLRFITHLDLQIEEENCKTRAVAVQQQAAIAVASKDTTVNDLTRGMINYKYLGLEFQKADLDRLRYVRKHCTGCMIFDCHVTLSSLSFFPCSVQIYFYTTRSRKSVSRIFVLLRNRSRWRSMVHLWLYTGAIEWWNTTSINWSTESDEWYVVFCPQHT
jgi:hypothetical protein